jgi:hypothetical protein
MSLGQIQRKFETREGIIIYPAADSLPQDVILIPAKIDSTKTLEENIAYCLSNQPPLSYIVYFQGIRWIQPTVSAELAACRYGTGTMARAVWQDVNIKITAGKIRFNVTWNDNILEVLDKTIIECKIVWNNKHYIVPVRDTPRDMGVPQGFEGVILYKKHNNN